MSLYAFLDRNIFLPIGEKFMRRNISGALKESYKIDWLSKEDLYELQCNKLQKLVLHCYNNVPYYTNLFNELGINPLDIKCREDLSKLPILTKEIIKKHYDELKSNDIDHCQYINNSTGGSTGTPMRFLFDVNGWNRLRAVHFRMWKWAGFDLGEKLFTLAGNSLVKKKKDKYKLSIKDLYDIFIMRNKKHDCTDITQEALAKHYRAMMKYKPKAIRGYASSLYFLARYIEDNNLPICPIVAVFTTGEKLHLAYRKKIQQVFKVPIFDAYGASDGGLGATECYMHEGLHIAEDNCIIEIVDSNNNVLADGEIGHVLTTDLNNYVFPFLRYKVGDLAYIKKELCSCGRGSRLLGEVIGREGKAIYNKEGRPFSSIVIDNMMFKNLDIHSEETQRLYERIERFQVRQDREGDLVILIKPVHKNEVLETFRYVNENFENYFPGSRVEVKFVDDIPLLASGKLDYCVSEFKYNS